MSHVKILSCELSFLADSTRLAQLEARRKVVVQRQQEAVDLSKVAFLKKKAERGEEQRRIKVTELEAKAARLGIIPRGRGQKLGSGESLEDESLYS